MLYIMILLILIFIIAIIFSVKLYEKNSKYNTLKKKLFFSISIIVCCLLLIAIFLIINSNQLNHVEKQVVDKILYLIDEIGIYNPKDLKLLEGVVEHSYDEDKREYSDNIENYYLKVVGTNRIGGTLNKCYQISQDYHSYYWDIDEVECDDIYKSALRYEHLSSKSIKSINKALQEHWEKLGL